MKDLFSSRNSRSVRWRQRAIERFRQTLSYLQRLLAVDRPPEALALIPIRVTQPYATRQRLRRTWRD